MTLRLPNKLILCVIDFFLEPVDIYSLSLVNRRLNTLLQSRWDKVRHDLWNMELGRFEFIGYQKCTPLHAAAETNNLAFAQLALTMNPLWLDMTIPGGNTALHLAVGKNSIDVVRFLLKSGANQYIINNEGGTPLLHALCHSTTVFEDDRLIRSVPSVDLGLLALLLDTAPESNASPNHVPNNEFRVDGARALLLAATLGSPEIITIILDSGVNINAMDNYQSTALHESVSVCEEGESLDVIELFLSMGIAINARDINGRSPLFRCRSRAAMALLLANGASVQEVDHRRKTFLHHLVEFFDYFDMDMVPLIGELLKVPDIDLGATDRKGWTALHYAKAYTLPNIVAMIELAERKREGDPGRLMWCRNGADNNS